MNVGVVDIGTNSMRLLITSEDSEIGRWVEVTGLGRGLDDTGRLSDDAMTESLAALKGFGEILERHGVSSRKAIATSASRDASNRDEFLARATQALGVEPTLISGEEEARYAFVGATSDLGDASRLVINDIGGGSTEFVDAVTSISIDVGSVRLTDRILSDRPPSPGQLRDSIALVREMFARVDLDGDQVVGIAGTWTSLAAVAQNLARDRRVVVHGYRMGRSEVGQLVDRLSRLSLAETKALPSLHPRRAPVILAGAVIAQEVMVCLDAEYVRVSELDTLDGVAAELLSLR